MKTFGNGQSGWTIANSRRVSAGRIGIGIAIIIIEEKPKLP